MSSVLLRLHPVRLATIWSQKTGGQTGRWEAGGRSEDYLGLGQRILDGVGPHRGDPALEDRPLEKTFGFWRQSLFRLKVGHMSNEDRRNVSTSMAASGASNQDGCADGPRRLSSHRDSLGVASKGLDVVLHPPQGRQLVQQTPVPPGVLVPGAVDEENTSLPRMLEGRSSCVLTSGIPGCPAGTGPPP